VNGARRRGSALVSAMFGLAMVVFLGTALMTAAMGGFKRSREDLLRASALDAAEAGVDRAIYFLRYNSPDGSDDGTWRTAGYTEELTSDRSFTVSVEDGDGDNSGRIVIDSTGTATLGPRTQRRRLVAVVTRTGDDSGCWSNLIFAGVGQSGKAINGNVRMRGRIHILGDGEPFTDSDQDGAHDPAEPYTDTNGNGSYDGPLTPGHVALAISGNADIANNYNGIDAALLARIPPCPTQTFGGEPVQSLGTTLRVKHGRVDISGSGAVGYANVAGGSPAVKETVNGVYVTDGFGGNQGSASVRSDNGTTAAYDMGNRLTFPDVLTPTTIDGSSYASHMHFLQQKGLTITPPGGVLTLKPNQNYGPYCDAYGNRIYVNGTTRRIEVQGIVYIDGDLHLSRGQGSGNDTFTYVGRGTLATTGSLHVHTHLLPAGEFPTDDALGLLARRDVEIATGNGDSQLNVAGAVYAQECVVTGKQTNFAGAMVANYFDLGNNVPHLYHVPKLAERDPQGDYQFLPPGLPGGTPTLTVSLEYNGTTERVAGAW